MSDRQPKPAQSSTSIPSLDEVRSGVSARKVGVVAAAVGVTALAGGALYAADPPQCGSSRADELQAHGDAVTRAVRRADAAQAVREIGVAMGWVRHGGTSVGGGEIHAAGEAMNVSPTPPETVSVHADGGIAEVDPAVPAQQVNPPTPPQPPHPPTGGAPMPVQPHPPQPPRPPQQTPVLPPPTPPPPGGMPAVHPQPPPPPTTQVTPHMQPRGGARRIDPLPSGRLGDISVVTPLTDTPKRA